MPLFVPFAIFLMHDAFLHSDIYDKVYTSKQECMEDVSHAVQNATEKAPEGGRVIGGCLPLPEGTKPPVDAPKSPQKHSGPETTI